MTLVAKVIPSLGGLLILSRLINNLVSMLFMLRNVVLLSNNQGVVSRPFSSELSLLEPQAVLQLSSG